MWRVRGLTCGSQGGVEVTCQRILLLSGYHTTILMCSPGTNKQRRVSLQSGIIKKRERSEKSGRWREGETVWEGEDEEKQKETGLTLKIYRNLTYLLFWRFEGICSHSVPKGQKVSQSCSSCRSQ